MNKMFSQSFVILCVLGMTMAFAGEYVPKSYYVIDREGHKSDVVYIRSRRSLSSFPLLRSKRGNAESSAGGSAHAGAGVGAGGSPIFFGGADFVPNIPSLISNLENNIHNAAQAAGAGSGGRPGGGHSYAKVSSADQQGRPGGGFEHYNNDAGPTLFSRFGEGVGSGIQVSGSASGPNGGFSASSSSVDSDGKIKYSVKSGKF